MVDVSLGLMAVSFIFLDDLFKILAVSFSLSRNRNSGVSAAIEVYINDFCVGFSVFWGGLKTCCLAGVLLVECV